MDEAKFRACLARLYIGITLHNLFILETDCSFAAYFLAKESINRSPLVDLKKEAQIVLSSSRVSKS